MSRTRLTTASEHLREAAEATDDTAAERLRGFADRLKVYVEAGGTAVMTYWSAIVNESDLCYLGGVPGGAPVLIMGATISGLAMITATNSRPSPTNSCSPLM